MNIQQIPAHPNNYGQGRTGKKVNKVVLHWIVGSLESADATFQNPDRGASAHYGIGDNEVHQWVNENDTAWHASNLTVNRESIGIEHEGGWLLSDGTRKKPSDKTHETSARLVADICKRYSIPIDREHIRLHKEYSNTQCPGLLDANRIIEMARGFVAEPPPDVITDGKTKIDLGDNIGIMEVQAIKSVILDSRRSIENLTKENKSLQIKVADVSQDLEKCRENPPDNPGEVKRLKQQLSDTNEKIDTLELKLTKERDKNIGDYSSLVLLRYVFKNLSR